MADLARKYSAANLELCGCGGVRGIRKKMEKIGTKHSYGKVEGNRTKLYHFDHLPIEWQKKIDQYEAKETLKAHGIETDVPFDRATVETDAISYSDAPQYNREKFDKYAIILHESEPYDGYELEEWVKEWNKAHPDMQTSRSSVMRKRKEKRELGKSALLGQYGKSRGKSKVSDIAFEDYRRFYMKEGGPSANRCWMMTLGLHCTAEEKDAFPQVRSFSRRLEREIGASAIFLARNGWHKWNRKYGSYIERDYDQISAGEIWVSDHAQIDVAVKSKKDGKPVFGWITSFTDMKTGKCMSCFYHEEAPNSDHIFQAFYMAALEYGVPQYVYIDNGKDYRCKDFAGGRKSYRRPLDEKQAQGMLLDLGIIPVFAIPYRAQSKTIERWHLRIKETLSRNCEGFRGGNVTERPEKLLEEIRNGAIPSFEEFNGILLDVIYNVLDREPSNGLGCKGRSPNDVWNLENPVKRMVTRDALKLFCSRTSKALTIGRNGVKHSVYAVTYFADWMIPLKGAKVYLRIAPDNINDAWVFEQDTDRYLGNASVKGLVHPIATAEVDRAELREAIAGRNRELKMVKDLGAVTRVADVTERVSAMKAGVDVLNPTPVPEPQRNVERILPNCAMQQAVTQRKRTEQEGTADLSQIAKHAELAHLQQRLAEKRGQLLHFECDRQQRDDEIKELEEMIQQIQKVIGQ